MASEITERIKRAIRAIPRGRVSTYGAVALAAGMANGARQVVRVLHSSAESEALPWHRILRKDGTIALAEGSGFELQRTLLEKEGVEVGIHGKVDLAHFSFDFGAMVFLGTASRFKSGAKRVRRR